MVGCCKKNFFTLGYKTNKIWEGKGGGGGGGRIECVWSSFYIFYFVYSLFCFFYFVLTHCTTEVSCTYYEEHTLRLLLLAGT